MWVRRKRDWELSENEVTPEGLFMNRRRILKTMGIGTAAIAGGGALIASRYGMNGSPVAAASDDPSADLYPVPRNEAFVTDEAITPEDIVTSYNNFYEFGSHKQIASAAQELVIRPWTVEINGLVEEERTVDIDDLLQAMPLEERVYRHRCVEAWSFVAPWSGFPLKALVDYARPLGSAKYIEMQTFMDSDMAPGQRAFWYPWPYIEGLTMAEATNELAFMVTGAYGQPLPKQNGSPLRLAVPWKYGFKHIKSIVRLTFTEERPKSFWEEIAGNEYGFWANVNPQVPHPRWSQADERRLGIDERIPTLMYNGYAEQVASLYPTDAGTEYFR
ncbi:MAG: protein-methionine-sulfoxide reductase catalytic subunit MsrP [Pseudomonadota bacterium]